MRYWSGTAGREAPGPRSQGRRAAARAWRCSPFQVASQPSKASRPSGAPSQSSEDSQAANGPEGVKGPGARAASSSRAPRLGGGRLQRQSRHQLAMTADKAARPEHMSPGSLGTGVHLAREGRRGGTKSLPPGPRGRGGRVGGTPPPEGGHPVRRLRWGEHVARPGVPQRCARAAQTVVAGPPEPPPGGNGRWPG